MRRVKVNFCNMDFCHSEVILMHQIDGLIDRINEELGEDCAVVATGGLACVVAPLCRHRMVLEDDLLLKGLLILYEKNRRLK